MADKMPALLDATARQIIALLASYSQRPDLPLVRALRATLAQALNAARLVGVLHANSKVVRSPALPESESTGGWDDEAETLPSHRPRRT
jgi:hypothetical protein